MWLRKLGVSFLSLFSFADLVVSGASRVVVDASHLEILTPINACSIGAKLPKGVVCAASPAQSLPAQKYGAVRLA
jgi:hypothetical protein